MISIQHIKLLINSIWGQILKFKIKYQYVPSLQAGTSIPVIVSLTSYGRRVKNTVYYTLKSLFNQSIKPQHIILWLSKDEWNDETLPKRLLNLKNKGLEIRYCEDIKSFKKLIPTLIEYPESIIVTVDDDVIYSRHLLRNLYSSYLDEPDAIHSTRSSVITFCNGLPTPYSSWLPPTNLQKDVVPIGIGGVLYPPHTLYPDVINNDLFMRLCPNADDLWFWYMAKLLNVQHIHVPMGVSYYSFDAIYQSLHLGSALTHSNVKDSLNDTQLNNILEYYKYRNIQNNTRV